MNTTTANSIANLRLALQTLGSFSERDLDILVGHFTPLSIVKDDYLIKPGKTCQSIYFIEEGSFRQYTISDSGEELTQNLYLERDWMLEYKSFTSQQPSTSSIQATEDSNLLVLSVHDLHKLMKLSDVFFQVGRIFQFAIKGQEMQAPDSSPKERYAHLLQNKPRIVQRFPLKYIASYLGMAPETLSRVRKNLAC